MIFFEVIYNNILVQTIIQLLEEYLKLVFSETIQVDFYDILEMPATEVSV